MQAPKLLRPERVNKSAPRAVRIIGGQWRRTPLEVLSVPGLRPTPDRVRETVFNWLTHLFEGTLDGRSVLDLFAGTGAFGFEAASRGASRVLCVENQPKVVAALRATQARLNATQIEIKGADAFPTAQWLARTEQRFDVVFLDPPFHQGWMEKLLPVAKSLVTPHGYIYVESEAPLDTALLDGLQLAQVRADKAGQVFYHLLQCKKQDGPEEGTAC